MLRDGQEWCTLCHADLRVSAAPVQEPAPWGVDDPADPLTAPLALVEAAVAPTPTPPVSGGRHARSANTSEIGPVPGPSAGGPSEADIDAMLAQLALQSGSNQLGEVSGLLGSRSAKVAAAIGLCVALTVALLLGSVVLTAVFG